MSLKRFISARSSLFVAGLVLAAPACFSASSAQGQSAPAPLSLKANAQAVPASQAHAAGVASAEEESTPLKDDASHQGIKVHGHRKIVVKNPDGSIALTREFENSLTSKGGGILASLLVGGNVVPYYPVSSGIGIDLMSSGTSICGTTNCIMVPSNTLGVGGQCTVNGYSCSTTTSTATVGGANNGVLTLAGQFAATQSGTITSVASIVGGCLAGTSSTACEQTANQGGLAGLFTSTNITAITVNAGQLVQATVTISFS
jgi:hypothetical protein